MRLSQNRSSPDPTPKPLAYNGFIQQGHSLAPRPAGLSLAAAKHVVFLSNAATKVRSGKTAALNRSVFVRWIALRRLCAVVLRTPGFQSLSLVAIATAKRRGERLSLRWCDVDLVQRVAPRALTKDGDTRHVPLAPRAVSALLTLRAERSLPTERLFPMRVGGPEQTWMRLRERAGSNDHRLHELRHAAVTGLFEGGLGMADVGATSGNRELRMLSRDTRLRAADRAER